MNSFQHTLDHLHRSRLLGRLLLMILSLAALYGLAMLLHGFADYHLALDSSPRQMINIIIWLTLSLMAAFWIFKIFKTSKSATAALADTALGDHRRRSLSATHLSELKADTPMNQFHLDRSLEEAGAELKKLPFLTRIPAKAIALSFVTILVLAGIVLGLKNTAPFDIVSQRIFHPGSDTPPYSPLIFTITPDQPQAIYQGDATVHVEISNGPIEGDVFCLIRDPATGNIEKTTTFQENPTKFARKFDNALAPLEFAFVTGRARSNWHQLDVLFQPRISGTSVTITPPAYTGRPPQNYPLEAGEIKALEGSTIQLNVQSNRPLSGGSLSITSMDQNNDRPPEEIIAEVTASDQVTFTWTAHRSSKLSALIKDIRYTKAEKPLELTLKTIPDQAPLVSISEPQPMVFATPRSKLPLIGDAEDDLGLAKVSLTRTLVGYRDRSLGLAESLAKKHFNFDEPLELEPLGVEPGQTLEFYLEAADRNPSLLGIGVSDVVRIQIISEDDYAQRIRYQFELKEFTARYQALAQAIQESRESLKKLKESKTKEEFEENRKKAAEAHARAEELARKLADDFKAFDMESRLQKTARQAADTLAQNKDALNKLPQDATPADIEALQARLGGVADQANQLQQDAELVRKIGEVLTMAAEYKRLLNAQKSIVERLREVAKQIALGNTNNANRLEGLARVQENNRRELLQFAKDLRKHADALGSDAPEMLEDVDEFLESLEAMNIPDPMQASSKASKEGNSTEAFSNAELALRLMERLLEKPKNGF